VLKVKWLGASLAAARETVLQGARGEGRLMLEYSGSSTRPPSDAMQS